MHPTKKSLTLRLALFLLLAIAVPAGAKCVFRKSCTKKAFKCFQPHGTCSQELSDEGSSTVCWANGAKISSTSGVTTILGKHGGPCLTGTIQLEPTGESEVAYVRHGKTWVLRNNLDGTRSFVCPSGKVETYTADDFRSGIACGHIPVFGAGSACTPGTCE
jgi:hypothetical protein